MQTGASPDHVPFSKHETLDGPDSVYPLIHKKVTFMVLAFPVNIVPLAGGLSDSHDVERAELKQHSRAMRKFSSQLYPGRRVCY